MPPSHPKFNVYDLSPPPTLDLALGSLPMTRAHLGAIRKSSWAVIHPHLLFSEPSSNAATSFLSSSDHHSDKMADLELRKNNLEVEDGVVDGRS